MEESVRKNVAISFLMASTRENYNLMRQECLETYKLQEHDLPIFYYITKFFPKIDKGILDNTIEFYKKIAREGKFKKGRIYYRHDQNKKRLKLRNNNFVK